MRREPQPRRPSTPQSRVDALRAVASSLATKDDLGSANQCEVAISRIAAIEERGRVVVQLVEALFRAIGPWPARPSSTRPKGDDLFGSRSSFEAAFKSFEDSLRGRSDRAARAFYGDAFYDAVRREQRARADAWTHGSRESDPNRSGAAMNMLRADLAISWLWKAGFHVYGLPAAPDGSRRWTIPEEGALEYSDEGVVEVANRYGWEGGATRSET